MCATSSPEISVIHRYSNEPEHLRGLLHEVAHIVAMTIEAMGKKQYAFWLIFCFPQIDGKIDVLTKLINFYAFKSSRITFEFLQISILHWLFNNHFSVVIPAMLRDLLEILVLLSILVFNIVVHFIITDHMAEKYNAGGMKKLVTGLESARAGIATKKNISTNM